MGGACKRYIVSCGKEVGTGQECGDGKKIHRGAGDLWASRVGYKAGKDKRWVGKGWAGVVGGVERSREGVGEE